MVLTFFPLRFGFLAKLNESHVELLRAMKEAEDLLSWAKKRNLTVSALRGAMLVQNGGTAYDFDRMQSFTQLFEREALGPLFEKEAPSSDEQQPGTTDEQDFDRLMSFLDSLTMKRSNDVGSSLKTNRQYTSWLRKLVENEAVSPTVRAVKAAEAILQRGVFVLGEKGLVCRLPPAVVEGGTAAEDDREEARELSATELSNISGSARLAKDKQKIMPFLELEKELQALASVVEELRTTSGLPLFDHLVLTLDMVSSSPASGAAPQAAAQNPPLKIQVSVDENTSQHITTLLQKYFPEGELHTPDLLTHEKELQSSGGVARVVKSTRAWFSELLKRWEVATLELRKTHQSSVFNKYTRRELLLLAISLGNVIVHHADGKHVADLSRRVDRSPEQVRTAIALGVSQESGGESFFSVQNLQDVFAVLDEENSDGQPSAFLLAFLDDWFLSAKTSDGQGRTGEWGSHASLGVVAAFLENLFVDDVAARKGRADVLDAENTSTWTRLSDRVFAYLSLDEEGTSSSGEPGEMEIDSGVSTAVASVKSGNIPLRLLPSTEPLMDALRLHFLSGSKKAPAARPDNFLIASELTTAEELELFLLRATAPDRFAPSHLVNLEKLHILCQKRLEEFLKPVLLGEQLIAPLLVYVAPALAKSSIFAQELESRRLHVEKELKPEIGILAYVSEFDANALSSWVRREILDGVKFHVVTSARPGEGKSTMVRAQFHYHQAEEKFRHGAPATTSALQTFHLTNPELDATQLLLDGIDHHAANKQIEPQEARSLHLVIGAGLTFGPGLGEMLFRLCISGDVVESAKLAHSSKGGWRRSFQGFRARERKHHVWVETSNTNVLRNTVLKHLERTIVESPQTLLDNPLLPPMAAPPQALLDSSFSSSAHRLQLLFVRTDPAFLEVAGKFAQMESFHRARAAGSAWTLTQEFEIVWPEQEIWTSPAALLAGEAGASSEGVPAVTDGLAVDEVQDEDSLSLAAEVPGAHSFFGVSKKVFKEKILQPVADQFAIYGPHDELTEEWGNKWFPAQFLTKEAKENTTLTGSSKLPSFARNLRNTKEQNQEVLSTPQQYSERSILKLCIEASGLTDPTWSALMLFVRFFQEAAGNGMEVESVGNEGSNPFDRQATSLGEKISGKQHLEWLRASSKPAPTPTDFPTLLVRNPQMGQDFAFVEHIFHEHKLPAWERFMLQRDLLFRMARDFATPSVVQHDMSSGTGGRGQQQQPEGSRASWEESLHPYLFLTQRGADPVFFGFEVEGCNVMRPTASGGKEIALSNYVSPRIEAQRVALAQGRHSSSLFKKQSQNTQQGFYKQLRVVFGTHLTEKRRVHDHNGELVDAYPDIIVKPTAEEIASGRDSPEFRIETEPDNRPVRPRSSTRDGDRDGSRPPPTELETRKQARGRVHEALNNRSPDDDKALVAAAEALQSTGASKTANALRQRGQYALTEQAVLKLLALHKRLTMGVPIVLFGETGIGKTRMIDFLAQMLKEESYVIRSGPVVGLHPDWGTKFHNKDAPTVVAAELAKIENMKVRVEEGKNVKIVCCRITVPFSEIGVVQYRNLIVVCVHPV